MITEPGSIKILSENTDHSTIASIKKRLEISIDIHNSKLVAVAGHYDCAVNPVEEFEQRQQIKDAITRIKTWKFKIQLLGLWVNQNWQVEELEV